MDRDEFGRLLAAARNGEPATPPAPAPVPKQETTTMPELGGKNLAGGIKLMFADLRKQVEVAKLGVMDAGSELMTEIKAMKQVERAIRSETDAVRSVVNELLGNDRGEGDDEAAKAETAKTDAGQGQT